MNMIKVLIPNNYIKERKYIIEVLFSHFLGLQYEVQETVENDYCIKIGDRKLIIRDHFFSKLKGSDKSYLDISNVPRKVKFIKNQFSVGEDIPCIYGDERLEISENEIDCGLDLFASSFFMLTRWEEAVSGERDIHNRFPATASLAYRNNFLSRPVVNEYTEMLWKMLRFLGVDQNRREKSFELVISHDVDHIRKWNNWRQVVKTIGADIVKRRNITLGFSRVRQYHRIQKGIEKDPFDTFHWLMDLSESSNTKSHFYFMSGGNSAYDNHYSIEHPMVKFLIREMIDRGHYVGFHPSYNSYNDSEMWQEEKKRLEKIVGGPVVEGRQHYLRFQVPQTWQIWDDHGMEIDSTVGYADKEGFRCGTGDEFPVFNVLTGKKLNLKERPLIFMESRDFKCGGNVEENIFEHELLLLVQRAKNVKSKMTILFHNSSFTQPEYIRQYLEVLQCAE